jgi:polyketide cyclase/dehydrase/lipid transport protein
MTTDSAHVADRIDCSAAEVYAYVRDPKHIPDWAPGLGQGVEEVDGDWFVETGMGRVKVVFAPPNDYGVLDHEVTFPTGEVFLNPVRVVPYGDGCEIAFTVRRMPGVSDADFTRDVAAVTADLARLRRILDR